MEHIRVLMERETRQFNGIGVLVTQGEVADHHAPNATTTDMGSGKPASQGYKKAAYMECVAAMHQGAPDNGWELFQNASPGTLQPVYASDINCYSITEPTLTSLDNWFYYGGGGKGQTGCNY